MNHKTYQGGSARFAVIVFTITVLIFGMPAITRADSTSSSSIETAHDLFIGWLNPLSAEDQERADSIDAFFAKRKMPLAGYGADFVAAANLCDMDWRLQAAIAAKESSGGKFMFKQNNPFGWGSAKFPDLHEAIAVVGEHLCGLNENTARHYKDATTYDKLWHYNGTVINTYPREVISIMNLIGKETKTVQLSFK